MEKKCKAKVLELHQFFVEWLTGALPRTEESFARFSDGMAEGFVFINPSGVLSEKAAMVKDGEAAHGVHKERGFRVWIEDIQCRPLADDLCLATHKEWQEISGLINGRLSTALFRSREGAPNGVEWLHVHETWLLGHEGSS